MTAPGDLSRRTLLAAAAGLGAATLAGAPPVAVRPAALDDAVEAARKVWPVPGMCVAVVHGDEVHLKGYGVREAGAPKPVTPETLFGVGSCTKAVAAATAAVLVDAKKLAWDDPVRRHLPWFRMADPFADREATLRDFLCHRSGLHDRHDLLYYRAAWPLEENVRRLAHLELAFPFRSVFHYAGLNYFVVAATLAAAAGKPWHEFAREALLGPAGMTGVGFTDADWLQADDRASCHLRTKAGKVVVIPPWNPGRDQIDANGRLKASGRATAAWLRLHLAGGERDGRRVVSEAALRETRTPQVVIRREGFWADALPLAETAQLGYALGWNVRDYRGHLVVSHAGRTDGFSTEAVLVPGADLGFAILTNLDESWLPEALMHTLLDQFLGLPARDWNGHYRAVEQRLDKPAEAAKPKAGTRPTLDLAEYAGTYAEPGYGAVTVALEAGKLSVRWGRFAAELRHLHHDTFTATGDGGVNVYHENPLDGEAVHFVLDAEGRVGVLEWYGRRFLREGRR